MKYTVSKSIIRLIGYGWYGQTCAMLKELNSYDVGNLEDLGLGDKLSKEEKREVIEGWLARHSGDFQKILDFDADIELGDGCNVTVEWLQDSECEYLDIMYGDED